VSIAFSVLLHYWNEPVEDSVQSRLSTDYASKLQKLEAAYPGMVIDHKKLAERVVFEFRETSSTFEMLTDIHLEDLCIATACASGDKVALQHFSDSFVPQALVPVNRFVRDGVNLADVQSQLQAKLFLPVAGTDTRLGIEKYGGRGPLLGWLRVITTRLALSERRSKKSADGREAQLLNELIGSDVYTPELHLQRADLRAIFKEAFCEAVESLPTDEREALRMHVYESLSIDDLARIFDVHRATAARWLTRAREHLHVATREYIQARTGCSGSDLDSMVHAMLSRVDMSLSQVLGARIVTKSPEPKS
jgi:RNA polymerase sigma-70 factor, ECF subfamily